MGNLQVRFLEGWAPAMAPGYSTLMALCQSCPSFARNSLQTRIDFGTLGAIRNLNFLFERAHS
jgi:hypothetical protein